MKRFFLLTMLLFVVGCKENMVLDTGDHDNPHPNISVYADELEAGYWTEGTNVKDGGITKCNQCHEESGVSRIEKAIYTDGSYKLLMENDDENDET